MATRRGLQNAERFALDTVHSTASNSPVLAPCFVYNVVVSLTDTSVTGSLTLADSSASGDAAKEPAKLMQIKLGPGALSASSHPFAVRFTPPVYVAQTLVCAITNASVAVQYIAAS